VVDTIDVKAMRPIRANESAAAELLLAPERTQLVANHVFEIEAHRGMIPTTHGVSRGGGSGNSGMRMTTGASLVITSWSGQ